MLFPPETGTVTQGKKSLAIKHSIKKKKTVKGKEHVICQLKMRTSLQLKMKLIN